MTTTFPPEVLRLVVFESVDSIPTLKAVVLASRALHSFGRQVLFQFLRLPVREDGLQDLYQLLDRKPYLIACLRRLRLCGRALRGRFPTIDVVALDRLLYRLRPCPVSLGLAQFTWRTIAGGLRDVYPVTELSVHEIVARHPHDCPADLVHAFPPQTQSVVSAVLLHRRSDFPPARAGELQAVGVDVEMVEHWARNGVDDLSVTGVAELCCREVAFYHVDWVKDTVLRNGDVLTKLQLSLAYPVSSEFDWEHLDLQVCSQLEEIILEVVIPPSDTSDDLVTVLYTLLESLPVSLRYIELRFRFPGRSRLLHYSVRPSRLPWRAYSNLIRRLPALSKVTLSLVHDDPMIMWQPVDMEGVRGELTADGHVNVGFDARMAIDRDRQSPWWRDMGQL